MVCVQSQLGASLSIAAEREEGRERERSFIDNQEVREGEKRTKRERESERERENSYGQSKSDRRLVSTTPCRVTPPLGARAPAIDVLCPRSQESERERSEREVRELIRDETPTGVGRREGGRGGRGREGRARERESNSARE